MQSSIILCIWLVIAGLLIIMPPLPPRHAVSGDTPWSGVCSFSRVYPRQYEPTRQETGTEDPAKFAHRPFASMEDSFPVHRSQPNHVKLSRRPSSNAAFGSTPDV